MPFSKTNSKVVKNSVFCIGVHHITSVLHSLLKSVQLLPSFHPELWIITTAIQSGRWQTRFSSLELRFLSA